MIYYHITMRTDKCFDEVKAWLDEKQWTGFAVREVADENEHWHWYVRTEGVKINSFRELLRRKVPGLKGNGAYSVSEAVDTDKYWKYMCKGQAEGTGAEIVWRHGLDWTDEKFEELHKGYWETNRSLRKRKVPLTDTIVEDAKRAAVQWHDLKTLYTLYIKELVARNRPINTYAVKAAIKLIQVKLCPNEQAVEDLVNSLLA